MNNEEIEWCLGSYDDWETLRQKWPYCFDVEKERQFLFYFGSNHSHDPNNEQFPILKEFWKKFLEKTNGKNCVVFVEGRLLNISKSAIEEDIIQQKSEGGLITFLANKSGVPTLCPEPNRKTETDYLLQKFSREEVAYYYFARNVYAWHRLKPKPFFDDYINKYLRKWNDELGFIDFSLENMKQIHQTFFGTDFDENDEKFFGGKADPRNKDTRINEVAQACSVYRNIHIVSKILKFWREGKNIFPVFGGAHAVLQEPAIRKLI